MSGNTGLLHRIIPVSVAVCHRLAAAPWTQENTKSVPVAATDEERVAAAFNPTLFNILRRIPGFAGARNFYIHGDGDIDGRIAPTHLLVTPRTEVTNWGAVPLIEVTVPISADDRVDLDNALASVTQEEVRSAIIPLVGGWVRTKVHTDEFDEEKAHPYLKKEDKTSLNSELIVDFALKFASSMQRYKKLVWTYYKNIDDNFDIPGRCTINWSKDATEGSSILASFAADAGLGVDTTSKLV